MAVWAIPETLDFMRVWLPAQLDPEGDFAPWSTNRILESPRRQRWIRKARTFLSGPRIINERIHGEEIRMVKGILHRHVPDDLKVFFYVDRFEDCEVADVGPCIVQAISCGVAERRPELLICNEAVGDEPYVLVCHDRLGRYWIINGLVDCVQAEERRGCLRTTDAEVIASVTGEDP